MAPSPFELDPPVLTGSGIWLYTSASEAGGWDGLTEALVGLYRSALSEGRFGGWVALPKEERGYRALIDFGVGESGLVESSLRADAGPDPRYPYMTDLPSPDAPVDAAHRKVLRRLGWGRLAEDLGGIWRAQGPSWPVGDLPAACEAVVGALREGFDADPDDRIEVFLYGADMGEEDEDDGDVSDDLPPGFDDEAEELVSMRNDEYFWATCFYFGGVVLSEGLLSEQDDPWRDVSEDQDRAHAAVEFVAGTWSGLSGWPLCPLCEGESGFEVDLASDLWDQVGAEVLGVVWGPCEQHRVELSADFEAEAEVWLSGRPWRWGNGGWVPSGGPTES